jgi:hypothetical protein
VLGLLLELGHAEINKGVIEIFSTEMGVTVGSLNLEDTLVNGEEGDIESTTSEIENEDVFLLILSFVETVSNGGSGWLVDDSQNIQTGDGSGVLGGLSLSIVEISWDGNDCRLHGFTKEGLGDLLHLDQNHGRNLFGLEFLLSTFMLDDNHWSLLLSGLDLEWPELGVLDNRGIGELSTDKSLGIEDCVQWVSGSLILGSISDESLFLGESNVRWGGVQTLIVWYNFDFIVHPDSNAGVCGSEIDSYGNVLSGHFCKFFSVFKINLLRCGIKMLIKQK